MTKRSVCKNGKNVKSKFIKIFSLVMYDFLCDEFMRVFFTISEENQKVPQQPKVKKVKNPANSKKEQENQKLVLVNEIQRNDLVDENDVRSLSLEAILSGFSPCRFQLFINIEPFHLLFFFIHFSQFS